MQSRDSIKSQKDIEKTSIRGSFHMKITDVRTERYRWPKEKPIANGKHIYTHNELNLLIIDTDEGITGYGCS